MGSIHQRPPRRRQRPTSTPSASSTETPSRPEIETPSGSERATPSRSDHALARFLGCFSMGLGIAEVLAPGIMGRLTGVRQQALVQAYGMREIAAGAGILGGKHTAEWMWARVAGDAMDLAALGGNLIGADTSQRRRAWASIVAVAGVTALDVYCGAQLSARRAQTSA